MIDRNTKRALDALPSRGRKGLFRPRNPQKFDGDATRIVYRSSWECMVMAKLDADPNVLAWSAEALIIPWQDRAEKLRRYIPDFLVKKRNARGEIEVLLIEVKPRSQSPDHTKLERGAKSNKRFIAEAMVLEQNRLKWECARRYCEARGWRFVVLTERELGVRR